MKKLQFLNLFVAFLDFKLEFYVLQGYYRNVTGDPHDIFFSQIISNPWADFVR
jgi:hypothetical protein